MLRDVLCPATAADFRFFRGSSVAGVRARVYSFQAERLNSHWQVQIACSRNTIDFRNYHKYEADSSVTFENPAQKKP
jgi:hypothetical protein